MRTSLKILAISVLTVLTFTACSALLCDIGISTLCETYQVVYQANGADGGTVPQDGIYYQSGDIVQVLGNIGGLVLDGYEFDGWNTAANGAGISYLSGSSFGMLAAK